MTVRYVCSGTDGTDGTNSSVTVTPFLAEAMGDYCFETGGFKIVITDNGVSSTEYLCHGTNPYTTKLITEFSFLAIPIADQHTTISQTNNEINVNIPYSVYQTLLTNLTANFATSSTRSTVAQRVRVVPTLASTANNAGVAQSSGGTSNDFSTSLIYRVMAADGGQKFYTVNVVANSGTVIGYDDSVVLVPYAKEIQSITFDREPQVGAWEIEYDGSIPVLPALGFVQNGNVTPVEQYLLGVALDVDVICTNLGALYCKAFQVTFNNVVGNASMLSIPVATFSLVGPPWS